MSYSIPMTFISAENKADAMLKADSFAKKLAEPGPANEHIKANLLYLIRKLRVGEKGDREMQIAANLDSWLNKMFTVRCTFWSQYKLLGITGMDWPKECLDLARGSVYFQDSTDQDYEYGYWPAGIPFFQDRIMEVRALPDAEISRRCGTASDEIPEEDMPEMIEYDRRTLVYKNICNKLDLDHWLYDYKAGTGYEQFAVCGIYANDQQWDMYNKVRAMLLKGSR